MSLESQTISGLKWTSAAKLAGQLVNWAITLVVVRLLAPQDYGLMALSLAVISVLSLVAELGLGLSLVQATELDEAELAKVSGAVVSLNLAVAVVLVLVAPLLARVFSQPQTTAIIQLSALQFVFSAASSVQQALLTRDLQFKRLALIDMVSAIVTNGGTLLLAWLGAGVWSLVGGYQGGAAVRAALLLLAGRWVRPRFDFGGLRRHLQFGGTLTVTRLVWQVSSQADVLIAARFLGSVPVGIYSVALNLASMPMQKIMSIINQVAFPAVARVHTDTERLRRHLAKAVRLLTFVGVPAAWGLASVAPEFVAVAFGAKWSGVVAPLQVLCLIIPLRMVGALLMTSVVATGSASMEVRNTIALICVLPPCFLAGVHWGIVGVAWGWVVGIVVVYALVMPSVCRRLSVRVRDLARAAVPSVASGATMAAGVWLLAGSMPLASAPARLALLIAAGAATYLAAVTVFDRSIWAECRELAFDKRTGA